MYIYPSILGVTGVDSRDCPMYRRGPWMYLGLDVPLAVHMYRGLSVLFVVL